MYNKLAIYINIICIYIGISTDYNALADSAPADFGILQLMTNRPRAIPKLWSYSLGHSTTTTHTNTNNTNSTNTTRRIWHKRDNIYYYSTGIYLINREKLRLIIDSGIVYVNPLHPEITQYRIIAGNMEDRLYTPPECTPTAATNSRTSATARITTSTRSSRAKSKLPLSCIQNADIVADRYIYAMTITYISCIPLAYTPPGLKSTVQQQTLTKIEKQIEQLILPILLYIQDNTISYSNTINVPLRIACPISTSDDGTEPEKSTKTGL